jgi:hypothetical protein
LRLCRNQAIHQEEKYIVIRELPSWQDSGIPQGDSRHFRPKHDLRASERVGTVMVMLQVDTELAAQHPTAS